MIVFIVEMDFVVKFQGRDVPLLRGLVKAALKLKVRTLLGVEFEGFYA